MVYPIEKLLHQNLLLVLFHDAKLRFLLALRDLSEWKMWIVLNWKIDEVTFLFIKIFFVLYNNFINTVFLNQYLKKNFFALIIFIFYMKRGFQFGSLVHLTSFLLNFTLNSVTKQLKHLFNIFFEITENKNCRKICLFILCQSCWLIVEVFSKWLNDRSVCFPCIHIYFNLFCWWNVFLSVVIFNDIAFFLI